MCSPWDTDQGMTNLTEGNKNELRTLPPHLLKNFSLPRGRPLQLVLKLVALVLQLADKLRHLRHVTRRQNSSWSKHQLFVFAANLKQANAAKQKERVVLSTLPPLAPSLVLLSLRTQNKHRSQQGNNHKRSRSSSDKARPKRRHYPRPSSGKSSSIRRQKKALQAEHGTLTICGLRTKQETRTPLL